MGVPLSRRSRTSKAMCQPAAPHEMNRRSILLHSVSRVPPGTASSSHRLSPYSSTLGASTRVTLVSIGVGFPIHVSFTVPTLSSPASTSKGAHSCSCAGSVSACHTFSGEWRSSRTRMSIHFSPSLFRTCAPLAGPGVYCSRSSIFLSFALPACQLRELNEVAAGILQHRYSRAGDIGGRHGELSPARFDPFVIALNVVGEEHGRGLVLLKDRLLIRLGGGVVVQRQLQFRAVRLLGRSHRQPAIRAVTKIVFLGKTEDLRIEAQGLALVVHVQTGHFDFHLGSPLSRPRFAPRRPFFFIGVGSSMRSRWRSRASTCSDQNRRNCSSQSSTF